MLFSTLDYFIAVAEYKNFTIAAERSNISQSALSKAIKKLEDQLNCTLFIRSRGGVELTRAGEILYEGAKKNWKTMDDVLSKIEHLNEDSAEFLRVAGGDGLFSFFMIPTINHLKFHEKYPNVIVKETEFFNSEQTLSEIDKGNLDFGLVNFKPDNILFDSASIGELHEVIFAGDAFSFLTSRGPIEWAELSHYPFILRPRGTYSRARFDAFLHEQEILPTVVCETGCTGVMLQMSAANIGLSVVQKELAESFEVFHLLNILPLAAPIPPTASYIVWRKRKNIPNHSQYIIDYITSNQR